MVDAFRTHIMQTKELGICPVRQIGGCSFFYMRISNVYIVIVVSSNANVSCAFKFVVEVSLMLKHIILNILVFENEILILFMVIVLEDCGFDNLIICVLRSFEDA